MLDTDRDVMTLDTELVTQSLTAGHKCADVVEPIYLYIRMKPTSYNAPNQTRRRRAESFGGCAGSKQ